MAAHPIEKPERHRLAERQAAKPANLIAAWKFRLAVLQHHRAVYRLARALLRDDREAEDVTQESFMRYWEHPNDIAHPRAWLLKVARHRCLDLLRSSGRLVATTDALDAAVEPSDDRDPAWHYQQHELAGRLRDLVDALPEPQRSLIVLFDLHGEDGATCARILDLNITQVKVYLHRARRRLRLALEASS